MNGMDGSFLSSLSSTPLKYTHLKGIAIKLLNYKSFEAHTIWVKFMEKLFAFNGSEGRDVVDVVVVL